MYQQVMVESGASLYVKNEQLYIETEDIHHLPIEDISTLVLSHQAIHVTVPALRELVTSGAAVIVCDEKYLPCGVLLPYGSYSRRLRTVRNQVMQPKPHKKQLWKQIVKQKIYNQGRCLELCGKENIVKKYIPLVKSGDSTHMEGVAASMYFKELYGDDFTREQDNLVNAMLNYGYAILRSAIARYLAVYGFEPSLGIFHHSELNPFNLADDLIEPFRPVVDLHAFSYKNRDDLFFVKDIRKELVELLNVDILSKSEVHSVNYAIERMVQSLSRDMEEPGGGLLLPEILPHRIHTYE